MANPTIAQLTSFMNTGDNILVRLVDANNGIINLGKVDNFTATAERKQINVAPINSGGIEYNRSIPAGHKGSITITRENGALDTLQAQIESRYYKGEAPMLYSIYVTVSNEDGSVDESVFTGCDLWVNGIGDWKKDSAVTQQIEFSAQLWQKIA